MDYFAIKKEDPQVYEIIKREEQRQKEGIELIACENYVSRAVLEAMGSILPINIPKAIREKILRRQRNY